MKQNDLAIQTHKKGINIC